MENVTIKHIDDLSYYTGEYAIPGIKFRYAAKELGVSAWGMNVLELEPNCTKYPEHDHVNDGQEEVYVVLKGSAILKAGDVHTELTTGMMVRVAPEQKRAFFAGVDGVTLLAIGGTSGKAFSVK